MARTLILGQLEPDTVCAIALGLMDNHRVTVTLDAVTLYDPRHQLSQTQCNWLSLDDPLDRLVREYLIACGTMRQLSPRDFTNAFGDSAATRARRARTQAREILRERGVLHRNRQLGSIIL